MKYEAPSIEIVRFQPVATVLTASVFVTESPIEDNDRVTVDDYDPFG